MKKILLLICCFLCLVGARWTDGYPKDGTAWSKNVDKMKGNYIYLSDVFADFISYTKGSVTVSGWDGTNQVSPTFDTDCSWCPIHENLWTVGNADTNTPTRTFFGGDTNGVWAMQFNYATTDAVNFKYKIPYWYDPNRKFYLDMAGFIESTCTDNVVMEAFIMDADAASTTISTTTDLTGWTAYSSGNPISATSVVTLEMPTDTFSYGDEVMWCVYRDHDDSSDNASVVFNILHMIFRH